MHDFVGFGAVVAHGFASSRASLTGHPIAQSGRYSSVYFIERGVAEIARHQAPAKSQLEAANAEKRAVDKTVGANSRVPDLVFDHVEFADRECVDSAKGAPRSAAAI